MPTYEFHCDQCDTHFTQIRKLADFTKEQSHACGGIAHLVISMPMIHADYEPYISPASGKVIQGKHQHEEDLRQTGCRLLEPGERVDYEKTQQQREVAEANRIEYFVNQTYASLNHG